MPSKHYRLGGSGAARFIACPGSVRLCGNIPKHTTPAADLGTDAHQLAEICLKDGSDAQDHIDEVMDKGNIVDEDMADAVQIYLDYVRELVGQGGELSIEKQFVLDKIDDEMGGTADASIYFKKKKRLVIADYKHGAGVAVEVEGNKQAMFYGVGAALEEKRPIDDVTLAIIQPRCPHRNGPIREWDTDLIGLLDYTSDLKEAAELTKDPNAPLITGDHCTFCPANGVNCPAADERVLAAAQDDFAPLHDDSLPYDPDELAKKLDSLDFLESYCKNIRKFAYNEAVAGRGSSGHKLVPKRASRKFKTDVSQDDILDEFVYLKEDDIQETKMKSLPQIEKVIKARFKGKKLTPTREAEVKKLNDMGVSESSGYNLVRIDNAREGVAVGPDADFSIVE